MAAGSSQGYSSHRNNIPFLPYLGGHVDTKIFVESILSMLARAVAVAALLLCLFSCGIHEVSGGAWWAFALQPHCAWTPLASALLAVHGFHVIPQWGVMLAVIAAVGFALEKHPGPPRSLLPHWGWFL